jgi:hypothetical protein
MSEIRAISEPMNFLGIEISQDLAVGTITISQESKALALAMQLGVTGSQRVLPLSPETCTEFRAAQPGEPMADKFVYQQVGSLLHPAQCTRPVIALPVSAALAAYSAEPSKGHYAASLDIEKVRWQHGSVGHHLGHKTAAAGVLMRCKPCSVPGHTEEHHRLGCHHEWRSRLMEQQQAGHHGRQSDGRRVPSLYSGVGRLLIDQGARGACLVVCEFSVGVICDDWA